MIIKEAFELTKPRERIYVKHVVGRFQRLRWMAFAVLLAYFLVLPWLDWDGRQAVWLDLPGRKFHFFGLTVWPHEMYLLAGLMFFAVFSLFFFTTLAGRLWCGYACPQTVFVSAFMEIERLVEGDRPRQMRLAGSGLTPERIGKLALKHGLFLTVSFAVGFTSVSYFIPAKELVIHLSLGELGAAAWFWLALVSVGLYLDGAFFREQICIYPCPYGRFQGVMTDGRSLVVGYDAQRGEPRRGAKVVTVKGEPDLAPAAGGDRPGGAGGAEGAGGGTAILEAPVAVAPRLDLQLVKGDCVDCQLCAQVCPQGIDIRNGLQGECIGCARCVDACDMVMTRVAKPAGLIRYDSASVFGREEVSVVRPKLVSYGVLAVAVAVAVGTYLVKRPDTRLDVTRTPGLYRVLPDGSVANLYTVRPLNLANRSRTYKVRVGGVPGAAVRGPDTIAVGPEAQAPVSLAIVAPGGAAHGSRRIDFRLVEDGMVVAERHSNFIAP